MLRQGVMPRLLATKHYGGYDCCAHVGGLYFSLRGLNFQTSEPVGAPSLFFSPSTAQYVILTLLLNLKAVEEVSNMFRLVNKVFQCLRVYKLDLRKAYNQVFNLLCLRKNFRLWRAP